MNLSSGFFYALISFFIFGFIFYCFEFGREMGKEKKEFGIWRKRFALLFMIIGVIVGSLIVSNFLSIFINTKIETIRGAMLFIIGFPFFIGYSNPHKKKVPE